MVVQYRVLVTSNEFVCVCLFTERCLLFSLLFLLALFGVVASSRVILCEFLVVLC